MSAKPRAMTEPVRHDVCLFAHYAPDRRLSHSVVHYLDQLRRCGLSVHLALSGMQRLPGAGGEGRAR